jgi:hypothetical protein
MAILNLSMRRVHDTNRFDAVQPRKILSHIRLALGGETTLIGSFAVAAVETVNNLHRRELGISSHRPQ